MYLCMYQSMYICICIYVYIYACIHVCRYIIYVSTPALPHSPVAVPGVGLTRGNRGDGV